MAHLLHRSNIRQLELLKPIHALLRHTQVQRIRLLHLLKLRQTRQHIFDRAQARRVLISTLGKIRIIRHELLEIRHQLLDCILHVPVPILKPDLIALLDLKIFGLFTGVGVVDDGAVGYLVAFFDGEEVVGHGLVGEFVQEWCEEVHRPVGDEQHAPWSVGLGREVFVEFGVEVEFVLDEAGQVRAEDAGFVGG